MTPTATAKLWTTRDIEMLPDDGFRDSLSMGTIFRAPMRVASQGRCIAAVGWHVENFVRAHDLGLNFAPCGFILGRNPDTLLEPDMSFVRHGRISTDLDAYPEMAPDLAVEILPPLPSGPSTEEKVVLYFAAGTSVVWAVDPMHRTNRVYRQDGPEYQLSDRDEFDGEDVLPRFRLNLARLFD
jgi:Uma2 family endonuclease